MNNEAPRPKVGWEWAAKAAVLAGIACGLMWIGGGALWCAKAKYPPFQRGDLIVSSAPDWYDAFLRDRQIAKKLRVFTENFQVVLGIAGAGAVVCGQIVIRRGTKAFYLGGIVTGVGCLTVVLALFVFPPIFHLRITGARNACINNLRQLVGAKEQWALEERKTASDIPTWQDLMGRSKYIKVVPECPAEGRYSINRMSEKPRCSIPAHTL